MGKRDALVEKYADTLRKACGMEPDPKLLSQVTIGCGPVIFSPEGEVIVQGDRAERARVKTNFLVRKLGLSDGPHLVDAIDAMMEAYDAPDGRRYRAVLYYLLVKHFGKEDHFI